MFVLMTSQKSLKITHLESKTRSVGQILEKKCVHSRDLFLVQILIKLAQNVCLDDFYDEYENGSFQVKNWVPSANLRITMREA